MAVSPRLLAVLVLCGLHLGTPVSASNPPEIDFGLPHSVNRIIIPESTTNGTELFNITATDKDSDSIDITIDSSETEQLVRLALQEQNGTVRKARVLLNARLDRDRSPVNRALWFKVSDGEFEIRSKVTLIITDVNDNPPFFEQLPYRRELPERTNPNGSFVHRVTASDPDMGPAGRISFSMTAQAQGADELYNSTFVMLSPTSGDIWLKVELDYEKRNYYQYTVFAKDSGKPPCPGVQCGCNNVTEPDVQCQGIPATFTVTVTDVQDTPPRFEGLPYTTQLPENTSLNASVLTVFALDGDRGVPNPVNYSISCVTDENCPFSMDPHTGLITVSPPGLDADAPGGRSYALTVLATEIQGADQEQFGETTATTKVSITIEDVNDNVPEFSHSVYYATVQENTPLGVPITINTSVTVLDIDQGTNSQFRLSVQKDGAPYHVFSTLPSSDTDLLGSATVMVSVNDSAMLDYEKIQHITFQIQAKESYTSEHFSNLTTIVLAIIDMNDNSPRFPENQTTHVNVTEHSEEGKSLANVTAIDEDSGDFGTVAYSLEDDFGGKFGIDINTGELTVQEDLDRDSGDDRFSLVVVAKDNVGASEGQRRSARHSMVVMVQDLNDNPPQFQSHLSQVAVQENAGINTTLMTLRATDKDQGVNGDVRYQVVSTQPQSNASTSPLALFDIKESTGEVFVNASLIGHPGFFIVTVMASDRGAEPQNATTSLIVEVKDVNVNPPKFEDPDQDLINTTANIVPNITILEEQPINTFIKQLKASDKDTGINGHVNFYLDPDLASAFLNFHLDPTSGNLSIRVKLDCDGGTDHYQISLRAQDQGAPISLPSVIPFIVYLKDIDDNNPEFPQETSPLVLSVKEMEAPVSVGFVNISTDKDRDPENRLACYYLSGGELVPSFTLDKVSGELRLMTQLDRTQTTQVTLQVKTTKNCLLEDHHFTTTTNNNNDHSRSSNDTTIERSVLEVRVEVEDINNHPPVFNKNALTVGLLYDVAVGTEVTDLAKYTNDKDTAEHSKHMFRLLKFRSPNSGSVESLNSTFLVSINGSVVTHRLFQTDEWGSFVLTVQAYDVDNLNDIANLTVYLVSNQQRVKLIFNKYPNEVNRVKGDMVKRLGEVLGLTIIADKIATHITLDGTPDPQRTDVFIHARYIPSGKVVPSTELVRAFDYNQKVIGVFQEYGVAYVSLLEQGDKKSDDKGEQKIFIIVILALAIVTVALALVLISSVRRYRRRLRAATTTAFVTTKDIPNNFIPPGTNKYTSENPLFGKDLKTDAIYRTEDKDNDSLDDNEVNGGVGGRKPLGSRSSGGEVEGEEPVEEQEMYLDVYDDDVGSRANHVSRLAMVLKEYDTHTAQPGKSHKPAARVSAGMLGGPSELWGASPHTRSPDGLTSGHDNYAFDEDLDNLQTTDI